MRAHVLAPTLALLFAFGCGEPTEAPPTPAGIGGLTQAVHPGDLQVFDSAHDPEPTLQRIVGAFEERELMVVAVVDHSEPLGEPELNAEPLEPTLMMVFGNPSLFAPLVAQSAELGIELPFKALIWTRDGKTRLGWYPPSVVAERYGVDPQGHGLPEIDAKIRSAFEEAVDADTPLPERFKPREEADGESARDRRLRALREKRASAPTESAPAAKPPEPPANAESSGD